MAVSGFQFELLMSKLDYVQFKLQEVEHSMKHPLRVVDLSPQDWLKISENEKLVEKTHAALQRTEERVQEMLVNLEYAIKEKIGKVEEKFEARTHALEDFLQKAMKQVAQCVKASEEKTTIGLRELENKLTSGLNSVEENLIALNISYQETVQSELKKVAEGMKTAEANTLAKFREFEKSLISKIDSVEQNQIALNISYYKMSKIGLKNEAKNKKALDILKVSVQNVTTVAEISNKILADHFTQPIRSCRQVSKISGKYRMHVEHNSTKPYEVFCEQNMFGGGWIVIQHRFNGSENFYRNWTEYRNGFGNVEGEFWLGLNHVHHITKNRSHELIVEVKDFHGNYGYARYGEFAIGNESESYTLKKLGSYSGTAGDAISFNKDHKFSTFDRNNGPGKNCAVDRHGAWWYYGCTNANLNGNYKNTTNDRSAIEWWFFKRDSRVKYDDLIVGFRGVLPDTPESTGSCVCKCKCNGEESGAASGAASLPQPGRQQLGEGCKPHRKLPADASHTHRPVLICPPPDSVVIGTICDGS
ncbi:angiopoietin-related protein 7-like [Anopheles ziemanni]|uniref:angiopoietin-related protein 7-like n=1 Tax=Anopheles coustani TaxID=139045 RepID=UPI00265AD8F1|nr:angiopoietin-related protein 7-like [Anopheles coustani]XP_058177060.1 angiopoietin-related protein 7-like [Anopheles ziemanni]